MQQSISELVHYEFKTCGKHECIWPGNATITELRPRNGTIKTFKNVSLIPIEMKEIVLCIRCFNKDVNFSLTCLDVKNCRL